MFAFILEVVETSLLRMTIAAELIIVDALSFKLKQTCYGFEVSDNYWSTGCNIIV